MAYPPLQITFSGTGTSSGVPMIGCDCEVCLSTDEKDKRLRSSVIVQSPQTTVVVDTGPDFRQQMLRHAVKKLDGVLLTHAHKDHIAGLDDVRAFNYFQQGNIHLYGSEATLNRVRVEFDYAFFKNKYPGIPSITLHKIEDKSFTINDLKIDILPVWHLQMPVLGFRFGSFTYITDANRIDTSTKEKIKGSRVLAINALRHEAHISHFTLREALALADELQVPEVYFTHISHQMGLHQIINGTLPEGRRLAYDGLILEVNG